LPPIASRVASIGQSYLYTLAVESIGINPEEAKFLYAAQLSGVLFSGTEFASECVQCGKCLEKCPSHLDIPVLLDGFH
jgi:predicted aldo/keto reductase-like oxidoreductase